MIRQLLASLGVLLLLAAPAAAREKSLASPPKALMDTDQVAAEVEEETDEPRPLLEKEPVPAIAISSTTEIPAGQVGLLTPEQARLPESLWEDADATTLHASFAALPGGVASPTLRTLALRLLTVGAAVPQSEKDLLEARVQALLRMGRVTLAARLLEAVPQGLRAAGYNEQLFLLRVLHKEDPEKLCAAAENRLNDEAAASWQRWVVLCQAKMGEPDKARLGLELLREQNEIPAFYESVVQALLNAKKPLTELPPDLDTMQLAWLVFAEKTELLREEENPSAMRLGMLAAAGDLPEGWQALRAQYGLDDDALEVTDIPVYRPSLQSMVLDATATEADYRRAFLAYGLRKALGQPVSLETEAALADMQYAAEMQQVSPAWQALLGEAIAEEQSGLAALRIVRGLTEPLARYPAGDLALAVRTLYELGLMRDAYLLAREAMQQAGEAAPVSGDE